jgi:hypothetical protein
VYALGVVLRELSGGMPDNLRGLLGACLRDDPAARPTAREVELVLRGEREAPTRLMPSAPAAPTSVMPRPRSRRARTLVAAAACAVAVALAIGIGIGTGEGAGGRGTPAHEPAVVPPIPRAATPAASAQAFARWLRARSR